MSNTSSRRDFMKKTLLGASAGPLLAKAARSEPPARFLQSETSSGPKKVLEAFNYDGVRLGDGMLRSQYLATRDYYYNLPDDDILKGFRKRAGLPAPGSDMGAYGLQDTGLVFGQWLSGMARMYKATGDLAMRQKAARLMVEWAKTIEPDGTSYYPTLAKGLELTHYHWDKFVCGLVDLYEYCGEKDALPGLERITDWAMKNLDRARKPPAGFEIQGFPAEWYTLPENLYRAYQLTGESRFRAFGDLWRYDHYWGMFTGKVPLQVQGFHAYSHVNTLSSAAMTYAVTGEAEYLKTIVNAYDHFQQAQCYATGGYGPAERLVSPGGALGRSVEREANTFETPCGSWAVFKLGRYLIQFTGEARFGDWIEGLVYNGIGAALPMGPEGRTFYYADYRLGSDDPIGSARKVYYWDPYPCCSGTYIQAVADYHNIIYFKDAGALYVNLFVPSEVAWNHDGTEIRVTQETSYPESDLASLTLRVSKSAAFDLKFRVPTWSQDAAITVNRSRVDVASQPGTWATVRRTWQSGDRVTIQIPMRLRFVPIDRQHPRRVALMYGPVVLVQDGRYTRGLTHVPADQELSKWIIPTGKPLEFRVAEQPGGVFAPTWGSFMPFYQVGQGIPYRMYFDLTA